MISRWRAKFLLVLVAATLVIAAEETPPGLVSKNSDQDLVAEATNNGNTAQKREATLSNSYGEPLPPDAYGPPKDLPNLISDLQHPAPVYGVPDTQTFQDPPPGAYGPPAPVNFPSQVYHGPPPPVFKPKPIYGPPKLYSLPKPIYGPPKISLPKPIYGPPKKTYGPPKQSLPKPIYGVPFKTKVTLNKPLFNPKPIYGPPKPVYGPPKINFVSSSPPLPLPELPAIPIPPLETNNIDIGLNLPAPIYGTPLVSLPEDLKPNFSLPSDSYGPPGQVIGGPIGPDQVVFQNIGNIGHYGPPQPDPNPKPPHPGIPAPPTPPHVLYDGWKPIPGVSQPIQEQIHEEVQLHLDQPLPNVDQHHQFTSNQGYANIHQDALANIDLNSIVGGDSNGIDQSKTVFEAHYSDNHGAGLSFGKPADSYGVPPLDSFASSGPYPGSLRQQGAKGLIAPSGFYGVPIGSQYGVPPRHNPGLPLPYGYHSGGGHSGLNSPQKPIKFRESVPEGLFENIAQHTQHKDHHGIDHGHQGPTYLPPPIRDVKDINIHTANHGINTVSLSIEPTNLYNLPHNGNPVQFQQQQVPSNLYGSPIDSYAAPLLTVHSGDHVTSGSNTNAVTATVDGTLLANLSNLDAAAILKHCPYHEAILKAAQAGERIPIDLATSYVNSLSSLGTKLNKSINSFNPESFTQISHNVIHPDNGIKTEKRESFSYQKGKVLSEKNALKDDRLQYVSAQIQKTSDRIRDLNNEATKLQQKIISNNQNLNAEIPIQSTIGTYSVQIQGSNQGKDSAPHDQLLSEGLLQSILQAVEDPAKQQSFQQPRAQQTFEQQNFQQQQLPSKQQQNFQIQAPTKQQQSFQQVNGQQTFEQQNFQQQQQQNFQIQELPKVTYQNFFNQENLPGIILPDGYEPIDHSKDQSVQASQVSQEIQKPCDLNTAGSIRNEVAVPPPKPNNNLEKDENEVSIFFDNAAEPVTEISVATSISEEEFARNKS